MTVDFAELLRRAATQFPTQEAFAQALGISTSRLNRALNKGDYPLNALNCLKLASLTGASASDILRAAGKGDVADLVEQLYGIGHAALTGEQRELVEHFERIDDAAARGAVMVTVKRLALLSGRGDVPNGAGSGAARPTRGRKAATKRGALRNRKT